MENKYYRNNIDCKLLVNSGTSNTNIIYNTTTYYTNFPGLQDETLTSDNLTALSTLISKPFDFNYTFNLPSTDSQVDVSIFRHAVSNLYTVGSGTITPPINFPLTNVNITVILIGGGGGGGGASAGKNNSTQSDNYGTGGGSGSTGGLKIITSTLIFTGICTYNVGSGGTAGAGGPGNAIKGENGGAGGETYIIINGIKYSAPGGNYGTGALQNFNNGSSIGLGGDAVFGGIAGNDATFVSRNSPDNNPGAEVTINYAVPNTNINTGNLYGKGGGGGNPSDGRGSGDVGGAGFVGSGGYIMIYFKHNPPVAVR